MFLVSCLLFLVASPAQAKAVEETWLAGLYDDIAADLRSGRPLVVEVHIPLCDNRIIRCGGRGLGNGDEPRTNLYWATSGGFLGWFGRRGSGWRPVLRTERRGDVLSTRVWRRRFAPTSAWKRRGVRGSFDVFVVARAWRGTAIEQAMRTYSEQLAGRRSERLVLDDGTKIDAGGGARIISFVGHNGWMDVDRFDWTVLDGADPKRRGAIAIACATAPYLKTALSSEHRVPLLMTATLLFAGAHGFEGTVVEIARGGSFGAIRRGAAKAYGKGQDKPWKRVLSAFTNPSDRRWRRFR